MKDFPTDTDLEKKTKQDELDENEFQKEQQRIEKQNEYYHNNKWMYCSMGTVIFFFVMGDIFGKGGTIFNGMSRLYF